MVIWKKLLNRCIFCAIYLIIFNISAFSGNKGVDPNACEISHIYDTELNFNIEGGSLFAYIDMTCPDPPDGPTEELEQPTMPEWITSVSIPPICSEIPSTCNTYVRVICTTNNTGSSRTGSINFGQGDVITVNQSIAPPACNFTFSKTSLSFPTCGDTKSINITFLDNPCTLNVIDYPVFITLSNTVFTYSRSFNITCSSNTKGPGMSGYIVFDDGSQIFVSQDDYYALATDIEGSADVCEDGTYSYEIVNAPTMYMSKPSVYNWSGPLGSNIESGQGTTNMDVEFSDNSGSIYCSFDVCGEPKVISKQINIIPRSDIIITPDKISIIAGEQVTLQASGPFLIYSWTPANTIYYLSDEGYEVIASPTKTTTYEVHGSAEHSCYGIAKVTVTVKNLEDFNYIRTQTTEVEGVKNISDLDALNEDEKDESIQYIDELGRVSLEVNKKGSPEKKDLVQYHEYDEFGREKKNYLPFPDTKTNGRYMFDPKANLEDYYFERFNDIYPYAEKEFDDSPLNRVMKQGSPGADWQLNQHPVEFNYKTNIANYVVNWEVNVAGDCFNSGYYAVNQLYVSEVIDEDQHKMVEYKDKQGRTILKESYLDRVPLQTYYVYDDFGLLRYVLPPQCIKEIKDFALGILKKNDPSVVYVEEDLVLTEPEAGVSSYIIEGNSSLELAPPYDYDAVPLGEMDMNTKKLAIIEFELEQDVFDALAFQYKYDARKRMTHKKLPGAETIYMVYDVRDRLVLTQDGNMRSNNTWAYIKYDALNRLFMTGTYHHYLLSTQEEMQANVGIIKEDIKQDIDVTPHPDAIHGFNIQSYPTAITANDVLTVTYYDNYDIEYGYTYDYIPYLGYEPSNTENVKGLVTAKKMKILGTSDFLTTVDFYDEKDRVIQIKQENILGGLDIITHKYDFTGKVLQSRHDHSANGFNELEIHEFNEYDHAGRLKKIEHQIGSNPADKVILAEMQYNELGELIKKRLHAGLQDIDYEYNIRGWLTKINDPQNLGDDLFGMNLFYNQGISELGASSKFNGNIAAMEWATPANTISPKTGDVQSYGFSYDDLNRLTAANYGEGTSYAQKTSFYNVPDMQYDYNGNIKSIERDGEGIPIDDLTYKYHGNKLMAVGDQVSDVIDRGDFMDKSDGFNFQEYFYDDNGNMTSDNNKGITHIDYNHLNLPERIEAGANNYIKYIYSASGVKMKKEVYDDNNLISEKLYIGELIYNETELEQILTDEGKVIPSSGAFAYQYNLKDQLGNNRVSFKGETGYAVMVQEDHYYPFGMRMNGLSAVIGVDDNKYLYNGKELQDDQIADVKLDWYDYGFRMYDPALGRFPSMDPLADQFNWVSPYNYAENRPIDGIDLWGLQYLRYDQVENVNFQPAMTIISGMNSDGSLVTTSTGSSSTMVANANGTYNFSYLGTEYSNISTVTNNGERFFNMGQHITDAGGTQHTQWVYTDIQLFNTTTDHTYSWADPTLTGNDHLGNSANTNCAYLAEAQANELDTDLQGGVVSARNALNSNGGAITALNAAAGVDYINTQLEAGNAIVVGVNYGPGGTDVGTDHYVTITGRTSVGEQGRFVFMENAVGNAASVRNFNTNRFTPGNVNITGGSVYTNGMTVTRVQRNQ